MLHNASDRTLGLISIWQVLRKLYWEIELLRAIPEQVRVGAPPVDVLHVQDARIYAAVNACSTGLALVDWLYHTVREDTVLRGRISGVMPGVNITSEKSFLKSMRTLNQTINACHQICNANKHFHLKSPDALFKVMVAEIVMTNAAGETNLVVKLQIMNNGTTVEARGCLEAHLKDLADWWECKLEEIGVPGRGEFFSGN